MQITEDCIVSIQYSLTTAKGDVIDKTEVGKAFSYVHGKNEILPHLEKELYSKSVGDFIKVTIDPENGYGLVNPKLIQEVTSNNFDEAEPIKIGMQFQTNNDDGQDQIVSITDIKENTVTVNGNHPLAGETLTFDVRIEDIILPPEQGKGKCGCC